MPPGGGLKGARLVSGVLGLSLKGLPRLGRRLLAGAVLLVALAAGAGSGRPAPVAHAAWAFGIENSWIRVQNIGDAPATVQVDYFDEAGNLIARDTCPTAFVCPALGPGEGWTFFTRNSPALPIGFQGSAVVTTDQPIVAILAKDVTRGPFFLIAGDSVTVGAGSHRLYLPLVSNQDGPFSDWNGRFTIQNLSESTTVCVTITYISNYTDSEVSWDPYRPDSGTAPLAGCPKGGRPIPPRGSLFRDPDTMGVPAGFTGSVRIDTHTNAAGVPPSRQFIAASADTWNRLFNPFSSYRGLDEGELDSTLLLPLMDREVGPLNQWSTYFQIENKDPRRPADVKLHFEGWDLGQNPPQFVVKENSLRINAARLCFQNRDDFANCLAPGDRLPRNFVGTARLTSTQPLGVVVNRSSNLVDVFTSYRAFRPTDGALKVLLPVLNKNYGPYNGRSGWNSWFRVLVADGGSANVTVRYFGLDLPGGTVAYTQAVNREFTVFQYLEPSLPNGFAGTAILESDRPIVALANLTTDVFFGDTDLLYSGIPLP